MTNPIYISSDAMNALKEISRRHAYIKESKIIEDFIYDTHSKMRKTGGRVL